jgi:ABC-type branched-subunit amino acid transport system ATPase component
VSDPTSIRDIDVTGLGKRYGAVNVLHDVSFTLRDGEFLTLLGPSGSGKTTTLGIIAGFVDPDYGDVRVGDRSIVGLPPRHRNLGIVFQNYALVSSSERCRTTWHSDCGCATFRVPSASVAASACWNVSAWASLDSARLRSFPVANSSELR